MPLVIPPCLERGTDTTEDVQAFVEHIPDVSIVAHPVSNNAVKRILIK